MGTDFKLKLAVRFLLKKMHQGEKNVLKWRNNSQTYNNAVAPKC